MSTVFPPRLSFFFLHRMNFFYGGGKAARGTSAVVADLWMNFKPQNPKSFECAHSLPDSGVSLQEQDPL